MSSVAPVMKPSYAQARNTTAQATSSALAGSGHFSQVLIADGNLPVLGNRGPNPRIVHLNLKPGAVDAVTVLDTLLRSVPILAATVMQPPPLFPIHREKLDPTTIWHEMERWAFYENRLPRTTLMVAIGGTTPLRQSPARNRRGEDRQREFLKPVASDHFHRKP